MLGKLKPPTWHRSRDNNSDNNLLSSSSSSSSNNTSLSVLASLLACKLEVIDRQPCDYFFPYPILSNPSKHKRRNSHADFGKLALVNIRFDRADESSQRVPCQHKRLLYLFISQMFVRPTACLKDALRSVSSSSRLHNHEFLLLILFFF